MKLISLNVRGLGNPQTRLDIQKILQMHGLDILFFYETKLMAKEVLEECRKLSYENYFGV